MNAKKHINFVVGITFVIIFLHDTSGIEFCMSKSPNVSMDCLLKFFPRLGQAVLHIFLELLHPLDELNVLFQ